MLPDNFLEGLPVNNHKCLHKVFPTFYCAAFNKLENGLGDNKMRSWIAELISTILLYCFFPLEKSYLFPKHVIFYLNRK